MTEEPMLRGFIARLQAKSDTGSEEVTYREHKYLEAAERIEKRKKQKC